MKHKVKRYQEGGVLTDRFGNPVRSGSGKPVRTRSADEIAEDMKRPMGGSSQATRSISPIKEDRSTKESVTEEELGQGPMDYATMGKRAGATPAPSTMAGPVEDIRKYDAGTLTPPKSNMAAGLDMAAGFDAEKYLEGIGPKGGGSGVRSTTGQEKKKVVKKAAAKKTSQEFPIRDRDRADQSFPLKTDYDKMKGRKAGGSVKMASGGKVSSASSRGDGIAQRGKTRGRIC